MTMGDERGVVVTRGEALIKTGIKLRIVVSTVHVHCSEYLYVYW